MLYFFLGFFFGSGYLLALYLTARSEYSQQMIKTERTIREKNVLLKFLHSLFEEIAQGASSQKIYQQIVYGSRLTTHGMSVCFFKYNPSSKELIACAREGVFPLLKTRIANGLSQTDMLKILKKGEKFFYGEGCIGECAKTLKTHILGNDEIKLLVKNTELKIKVKRLLLCPIVFKKELFGVIAVANSMQSDGFSEETCSLLKAICEQAGIVLNNVRQIEQLFEKNKLEFDLNLAHHIQRYLLPKVEYMRIPGLEFCITYLSSQKIGGDLYDIIPWDDHRTVIVIGDVTGKGIAAALIMSTCLAHLKHLADKNKNPAEILKDINEMLYGTLPEHMFITMLYVIIDTEKNTLELARAGHEYPFVVHKGKVKKLESSGMALGLMPCDIFNLNIETIKIPFVQGDILTLYTDGLTEAKNTENVEFSNENLVKSLLFHSNKPINDINDCIIKDVQTFIQNTKLGDDLTLISIRRTH